MNEVLVDTSVWIEFFRSKQGAAGDILDELLDKDKAVICGIVEMEIFQGLKKHEMSDVQSILPLLSYVEITRADFIAAGRLWKALREHGNTIPSTDCMIAAVCLRCDLTLLSLDAHFKKIDGLKQIQL
jgi:predicted nucleic acid-binding protein